MKKTVCLFFSCLILSGCSITNPLEKEPIAPIPPEEKIIEKGPSILSVVLDAQNNSTQDGVATIQEIDGKVKVLIATKSLGSTPQPAHIHVGNCPNPGAIKYSLVSVVNGKSETILDVDLGTLLEEENLAINIHKSAKESALYTACGDIQ